MPSPDTIFLALDSADFAFGHVFYAIIREVAEQHYKDQDTDTRHAMRAPSVSRALFYRGQSFAPLAQW